MTTLKAGDKAPDFEGINQDGQKIGLSHFTVKTKDHTNQILSSLNI